MARIRGVRFNESDVLSARKTKPLNVGVTRTNDDFFIGKVTPNQAKFLPISGLVHGKKVFLKPIADYHGVEREMEIRKQIKELGIAIPKAGVVQVRVQGNLKWFYAIEPYLTKGQPKLVPINPAANLDHWSWPVPSPVPRFLERLNPSRDKAEIELLAKDTAKLINAGILFVDYDFFGFYRNRSGDWRHVVMDTEELYLADPNSHLAQKRNCLKHLLSSVRDVWNDENSYRMKLFQRTLLKQLNPDLAVPELYL